MKLHDYWQNDKLEEWTGHHQTIDALKAGAEAIREVERQQQRITELEDTCNRTEADLMSEASNSLTLKQRITELEAELARQDWCKTTNEKLWGGKTRLTAMLGNETDEQKEIELQRAEKEIQEDRDQQLYKGD